MQESRYSWVMLSMGWLAYTCFGITTASLAPMTGFVMNDLNLDFGEMGFILGSWQLVYIFAALGMGVLMDRFGTRKMMGIGTALIALSCFLRAVSVNFETLLFAVMIFGVGGPAVSIGCPKLVAVWFSERRKVAAGVPNTGNSLGQLIALVSVNSLLIPLLGSWRFALATFGTLAAIVSVLWWIVSREPPGQGAVAGSSFSFAKARSLLKVRNAWAIPVAGIANFFFTHGLTNWLPRIIQGDGIPLATASTLAAIPTMVALPAVFIIPSLIKPGKRKLTIGLLLIGEAVTALFLASSQLPLLLAALILQGVASAAILPLFMLILMDTPAIGSENMGIASGLYFMIGELGGFGGPFVMGVSTDMTGSFETGIILMALLTCVMSFIVLKVVTEYQPRMERVQGDAAVPGSSASSASSAGVSEDKPASAGDEPL